MKAKYINPFTDFGFKKIFGEEASKPIPEIFKDEVFTQAFEKAEIAKYGDKERDEYEQSLKTYRDLKGVIDTAFVEGKIEGKIEGEFQKSIEIAKFMKAEGEPLAKIMRYTGLSADQINEL